MLETTTHLHVELCIPNDILLQQSTFREIIKRKLSDSVEVWPYSVAESFAPLKVITPTAMGDIVEAQTAAVAALADSPAGAGQQNWLAKEIKHAIKNKTNGHMLPPGYQPILIKTKHPHVSTLLVNPFYYDASQLEPKSVYYAVQAVLKEAQRLGYHRIALPVDKRHVNQILEAIKSV